MIRVISRALLLVLLGSFGSAANAACSWTILTNGAMADAIQVMGNFDCLKVSPTLTATDGARGLKLEAPTGNLSISPYYNSAYGTIISALDAAETNFIPMTLQSNRFRLAIRDDDIEGFKVMAPSGNFSVYPYYGGSVTGALVSALNSTSSGFIPMHLQASTFAMMIGNVGIGTGTPAQKLHVSGTIRQTACTTATTLSANSSGDIICTPSDARLKDVYGRYSGGLREIDQLQPVRFRYKPMPGEAARDYEHAGFIAQDLVRIIPQAATRQKSGYYALDTTAILAASVNAIKELKSQNAELAREIAGLKAQLGRVEGRKMTKTVSRS